MPSITKQEKGLRKLLKLTKRQEEIIIGGLLGDSSINKPKTKYQNAYFVIHRSASDLKYAQWEYNMLKDLCTDKGITVSDRKDSRTGTISTMATFTTKSLLIFKKLRYKWYPEGKKIVPRDLKITPLMLAVWIADDGHILKDENHYEIQIATNGFEFEDVIFLKNKLEIFIGTKFDLQQDKGRFKIHCSSITTIKILDIISPYLTEMGMERKIPDRTNNNSRFLMQKNLLLTLKENNGSTSKYLLSISNSYKNRENISNTFKKLERYGIIKIDRSEKTFKYFLTELGEKELEAGTFYKTQYFYCKPTNIKVLKSNSF